MAKFKAGDIVIRKADSRYIRGLTAGAQYEVRRVSSGELINRIGIVDDLGRNVFRLAEDFSLVTPKKTAAEAAYDLALVMHRTDPFRFPAPVMPKKTPRSIKVDPQDVKDALSRMVKEVYGIDAKVEQAIGAMDKSLELVFAK